MPLYLRANASICQVGQICPTSLAKLANMSHGGDRKSRDDQGANLPLDIAPEIAPVTVAQAAGRLAVSALDSNIRSVKYSPQPTLRGAFPSKNRPPFCSKSPYFRACQLCRAMKAVAFKGQICTLIVSRRSFAASRSASCNSLRRTARHYA